MNTFLLSASAALFAVGVGTTASAASFDFDNLADLPGISGTNEGSWESRATADYTSIGLGTFDGATDLYTVDGISVKATGGSYDPNAATADRVDTGDTSAYLDKGNAGLGAARTSSLTSGQQADPSNDDNAGISGGSDTRTGYYEFLTLTFSEAVLMTAISFDNDGHNAITSGKIGYSFGAGNLDFLDLGITGITNDYSALGASTVWNFAKIEDGHNFYIKVATVSPVPVPAAFPLLLAGLGGLGLMGRRRRKAV